MNIELVKESPVIILPLQTAVQYLPFRNKRIVPEHWFSPNKGLESVNIPIWVGIGGTKKALNGEIVFQ